jgi:hypothetical protein
MQKGDIKMYYFYIHVDELELFGECGCNDLVALSIVIPQ